MEHKTQHKCVSKDDFDQLGQAITQGAANLRTNIVTEDGFNKLLKKIRLTTKINFVTVRSPKKTLKRYVWSKRFRCAHNNTEGNKKIR
jgi:hypothetical protein